VLFQIAKGNRKLFKSCLKPMRRRPALRLGMPDAECLTGYLSYRTSRLKK
jgi:hypothetical protein